MSKTEKIIYESDSGISSLSDLDNVNEKNIQVSSVSYKQAAPKRNGRVKKPKAARKEVKPSSAAKKPKSDDPVANVVRNTAIIPSLLPNRVTNNVVDSLFCSPMTGTDHPTLEFNSVPETEMEVQYWTNGHALSDETIDNYVEEVRQTFGFDQEKALGMLIHHRFDVTKARETIATYENGNPDCWSIRDDLIFRLELINLNFHLIKHPSKKLKSGYPRSRSYSAPFPLMTRLKQVLSHKSSRQLVRYFYQTKCRNKRPRLPSDDGAWMQSDELIFRVAVVVESICNTKLSDTKHYRHRLLRRVLPRESIDKFSKEIKAKVGQLFNDLPEEEKEFVKSILPPDLIFDERSGKPRFHVDPTSGRPKRTRRPRNFEN